MSSKHGGAADLDWEEIGFLCEGLSFASQPMRLATRDITERYSLGPRGAWILRLIRRGRIYPLDAAKLFRVGRSLITAELARLTDAGLVTTRPGVADRRRTELALTDLGRTVGDEVQAQLTALIRERLGGYTSDEIRLCARMLRDFRIEPNG